MSNLIRESARHRLAVYLLGDHGLGPDDVAEQCWQDRLDLAEEMIASMEAAGLQVVPDADQPLPHVRSERISVMGDTTVIEAGPERYLDQQQLMELIQDLMVAGALMSLSPPFVQISAAA